MTSEIDNGAETGFDRLLQFTLPDRNARGRIVRLGPALEDILAAHPYPPALKHLLSEALVLTALMGALLKDEGSQLTLQAQAHDGIVNLLVCDYRGGELRGYARHDEERFAELGTNPSLSEMFEGGYLAITFDLEASGQRYQGIVPLHGHSLAHSVEQYFAQSEQVPTLIRIGVRGGIGGIIGAGLLVQHLAEGEGGGERLHHRASHLEWDHVVALAGSLTEEELVDPELSLETLVWRLFHEEREVLVLKGEAITRGCRCSVVHFEEVLARFSKEDRKDMRDEKGIIRVDCAFCSREFLIED
jgi:molecular chaperone Hsp33|uniref:Hsp33 family molecular chaperone HslO n=1 Tax=Altererythrobacter segetis TaxID=1104773 RepID=UPI00140B7065|nr:Hsp33 family molecular chaperone HslO [Altererythrobacter segetis]